MRKKNELFFDGWLIKLVNVMMLCYDYQARNKMHRRLHITGERKRLVIVSADSVFFWIQQKNILNHQSLSILHTLLVENVCKILILEKSSLHASVLVEWAIDRASSLSMIWEGTDLPLTLAAFIIVLWASLYRFCDKSQRVDSGKKLRR